jgi:hypothetical protein
MLPPPMPFALISSSSAVTSIPVVAQTTSSSSSSSSSSSPGSKQREKNNKDKKDKKPKKVEISAASSRPVRDRHQRAIDAVETAKKVADKAVTKDAKNSRVHKKARPLPHGVKERLLKQVAVSLIVVIDFLF